MMTPRYRIRRTIDRCGVRLIALGQRWSDAYSRRLTAIAPVTQQTQRLRLEAAAEFRAAFWAPDLIRMLRLVVRCVALVFRAYLVYPLRAARLNPRSALHEWWQGCGFRALLLHGGTRGIIALLGVLRLSQSLFAIPNGG